MRTTKQKYQPKVRYAMKWLSKLINRDARKQKFNDLHTIRALRREMRDLNGLHGRKGF